MANSADKETKKAIAGYMEEVFMHFINEVVKRPATAAELAIWLGIPEMTISRLRRGGGIPRIDNMIMIANRMGPRIFDIVGMPRLMPSDAGFHELADGYFDLSEDQRRTLLNNLAELKKARDEAKNKNGKTVPGGERNPAD